MLNDAQIGFFMLRQKTPRCFDGLLSLTATIKRHSSSSSAAAMARTKKKKVTTKKVAAAKPAITKQKQHQHPGTAGKGKSPPTPDVVQEVPRHVAQPELLVLF